MANKIKVPTGALQALRLEAKFSQKAIAERLGVAEKTINNWESRRQVPSLAINQWLELAEAYGVSLVALNSVIEKDFPRN